MGYDETVKGHEMSTSHPGPASKSLHTATSRQPRVGSADPIDRNQLCVDSWRAIPSSDGIAKAALLFLLALALSAPLAAEEKREESRLFRALGYAMFASKAGDFASTELVLATGGYETNPLMQNRGTRIAGTIAYPVIANYATAKVYQKHPKLAIATRIAIVGLYGWAVAHNLREAAR